MFSLVQDCVVYSTPMDSTLFANFLQERVIELKNHTERNAQKSLNLAKDCRKVRFSSLFFCDDVSPEFEFIQSVMSAKINEFFEVFGRQFQVFVL